MDIKVCIGNVDIEDDDDNENNKHDNLTEEKSSRISTVSNPNWDVGEETGTPNNRINSHGDVRKDPNRRLDLSRTRFVNTL
jgi:hypothetical protein